MNSYHVPLALTVGYLVSLPYSSQYRGQDMFFFFFPFSLFEIELIFAVSFGIEAVVVEVLIVCVISVEIVEGIIVCWAITYALHASQEQDNWYRTRYSFPLLKMKNREASVQPT